MSEKKTLTLGSLFDGSGGFPLGGILADIEPKWSAEIEPFPVLVTHKRLPEVKHYGDVSGIKGRIERRGLRKRSGYQCQSGRRGFCSPEK